MWKHCRKENYNIENIIKVFPVPEFQHKLLNTNINSAKKKSKQNTYNDLQHVQIYCFHENLLFSCKFITEVIYQVNCCTFVNNCLKYNAFEVYTRMLFRVNSNRGNNSLFSGNIGTLMLHRRK